MAPSYLEPLNRNNELNLNLQPEVFTPTPKSSDNQSQSDSARNYIETKSVQTSQTDELSSDRAIDYTRLRDLLATGKWKLADEETLKVMLQVASREEEGWLSPESIDNFPCKDLLTIDQLWVKYSNGRFGFSVQKRIWESVGKNYEKFGDRVGWRKGWWMNKEWIELMEVTFNTSAPEGHLPLEAQNSICLSYGSGVWLGLGVILLSHSDL